MAVTFSQALWFLPFILPLCVFVAWSDMKFMRIPNKSVLTLLGIFAVVGLLALPLGEYAWRWVNMLVVLGIGFAVASAGLVGAGDAKFAAAMAPFVAAQDAFLMIVVFSAVLLAAFATHRLAKLVPVIRRATPDWESWSRKRDFPMGLALGGALIVYLLIPTLTPHLTVS